MYGRIAAASATTTITVDEPWEFGKFDRAADVVLWHDFLARPRKSGHEPQLSTDQQEAADVDDEVDTDLDDPTYIAHLFAPKGQFDTSDFLEKLASFYIKKACRYLGHLVFTWPEAIPNLPTDHLQLASLCSGSGTGELTFDAAVTALSDHFLLPLKSELVLTCEKEGWKQKFLQAHIIKEESDACLFDDVQTLGSLADRPEVDLSELATKLKTKEKQDLSKKAQFCIRHDRHCDPRARGRKVFCLKSGFSCKGNSRMNQRFSEFQQSMKQGDLTNSSVSTFYGTLGTIELLKPKVFILENVDSIGSETVEESNLSKVLAELRAVDSSNYAVQHFSLCTDDYLLPQSRR
eukprot:Skav232493  [mRNA]  locus=scaffold3757:70945:73147:- [translate_table: standard]